MSPEANHDLSPTTNAHDLRFKNITGDNKLFLFTFQIGNSMCAISGGGKKLPAEP